MKRFFAPMVGFVAALAGGLAVFGLVNFTSMGRDATPLPQFNVQQTPVNRETRGASYAPIIKRAAPSVVNIYSTRTVQRPPILMFPFEDLLRPYGGMDRPGRQNREPLKQQGLGSGVIVSSDGYILTANHVVEGADADGVKVALANDGRVFTAKIVGTDPPTDVAVLKIDAKDMPAIAMADSDKLEVGDICVAIGNPFGVGQTVTLGMVSALGRGNFPFGQITEYENFIQTDAAINQGNSGGALIDAEGRLIGINTAIFSPSGGNAGIGFAVPVNLARTVMEQLIQHGKFTRGLLGVEIQSLSPELADAFKLPDRAGALVTDVRPDSPGEKAGIKTGDVIRELNGKPVPDGQRLRLAISQTPPGTKVTLKVLRSEPGQKPVEKSLTATLGTLRLDDMANRDRRGSRGLPEEDQSSNQDALDGVEVTDLDPQLRQQYRIPPGVRGALVTNVDPGSTSAEAGLRPGFVILEIDRQPVRSADDAVELSNKAKGDIVVLRVWHSGGSVFIPVKNSKR